MYIPDLDVTSYRDELETEKYNIYMKYNFTGRFGHFKEYSRKNLNANEVTKYFKWIDFKRLDTLSIGASNVSGIFRILNTYIKYNGLFLSNLLLVIKKCPVVESFTEFLSYINSLRRLDILNLCFFPMELPETFRLPHFSDLHHISILKDSSKIFKDEESIQNVFIDNVALLKFIIYDKSYVFTDIAIKKLLESMIFIRDNDCSRHDLSIELLSYDLSGWFENEKPDVEYSYPEQYFTRNNDDRIYTVNNIDSCSMCKKNRRITIGAIKEENRYFSSDSDFESEEEYEHSSENMFEDNFDDPFHFILEEYNESNYDDRFGDD
uniref:F-box domain-containing protein n=1 Tax=Parastrongyloides trichosuri TaxID=131310 RepID=A0A0N5A221_PARTI